MGSIHELDKLVSELENNPELTEKRKNEWNREYKTVLITAEERYRELEKIQLKRLLTKEERNEYSIYSLMWVRVHALMKNFQLQ